MKGILLILLAVAIVAVLIWRRMCMGGRSPNASLVAAAFRSLEAHASQRPPEDDTDGSQ
jgi:hypothetical protein